MEDLKKLTGIIIAAAIEVHRTLGPGMLEIFYESCLVEELRLRGIRVERQVQLSVVYKGVTLEQQFYLDLLVVGSIIVEVKALQSNNTVHAAQLLTYLKVANKKQGLVLNFGLSTLKEGIQSVVNGY